MKQHADDMITDQLLVRFLIGEAKAAEREAVRQWLDSSVDNRQYYDSFVSAVSIASPEAATSHIDVDAEWNTFMAGVAAARPVQKPRVLGLSPLLLRVAAMLLLVAGAALAYLLTRPGTGGIIQFASGEMVRTAILPDGSTITLNKRSSLQYNQAYNSSNRDIQLSGEAYFSVTGNNELPFIIRSGEVAVAVLGTSFNVKTTADKTEIIVESGKVRVEKADAVIYLEAGEKATVYTGGQLPVKRSNEDSLYSYYRTKRFVCNGTPLRELVDALNNVYQEQIVLSDDKDGALPITTTFTNKPITEIVAVICATLQLKAVTQNNTIILQKRNP
ncbi:MAG TPA: FecR domain-containing protein [Chitinophaga sp.]